MDPNQQIPTAPVTPQQPQKTSFISGRTLVLIIILGVCAAFFLYLALNPNFENKQITKFSPTIPVPTPFAQSVLSIVPATESATPSTVKTYNVLLDSNINTINAVQLELSYDPKVLANVTVKPGSFFPKPLELIKDIDSVNGRISYALGIQPQDKGVQGSGTVAAISFTIIPSATDSSTTISFMPKTLVTAAGVIQSVLKNAQNVNIPLSSPQGTMTPLQK